ncbi:hypothetical protein HUT16_17485 [Kitasatospora sp. NA04385]|uniref:hypothetical protein n=1 Tax=Kitasatospora sp. NA04385 TaxID=2742135 RepID=UPI001590C691|nr:hypothetical protein [Kitasatospora sp. NA04385]QKW20625.1 hypothetical protein HUT16_17485 [Kitasatospora sp. NA04385]
MIDNLCREWTASDQHGAAILRHLWWDPEQYEPVASCQNRDGSEHFIVVSDVLAYGMPWVEQRATGIHLRLDPAERICHAREQAAMTYAWASHWLVQRGADPAALAQYRPVPADPYGWGDFKATGLISAGDYRYARPADARTRVIEERIRRSGDRYRLLGQQMAYSGNAVDDDLREAHYVLLLDNHPHAAERRYVVQLETVHRLRAVYTLDEGGFQTEKEAKQWVDRIDARDVAPLPATDPATGLPAAPRIAAPTAAPAAFQPPSTPRRFTR